MMERSVPTLSSGWSGMGTVTVPASVLRCMTTWLPRRRTSTKPCLPRIRQTSRPDRTRSLATCRFEGGDQYLGVQALLDFSGIGGFQKQFHRFLQIGCCFLDGWSLAGDIQLRTQGNIEIAFALQNRGIQVLGHGYSLLCEQNSMHSVSTMSLADVFKMVPRAGLEPARLIRPRDFKSLASTNSATRAVGPAVYLDGSVTEPRENGGWGRNRTGVRGFAGRCITILQPSRKGKKRGKADNAASPFWLWSGQSCSNPRPHPLQGCALPTKLRPRSHC